MVSKDHFSYTDNFITSETSRKLRIPKLPKKKCVQRLYKFISWLKIRSYFELWKIVLSKTKSGEPFIPFRAETNLSCCQVLLKKKNLSEKMFRLVASHLPDRSYKHVQFCWSKTYCFDTWYIFHAAEIWFHEYFSKVFRDIILAPFCIFLLW